MSLRKQYFLYVIIHVQNSCERKTTFFAEYEENLYESQENSFEKNTDSDIDELNYLIGNLHPYC